ncbi:LysR substrate-binding domain-containing protein [Fontimonas sp. SYSU GA230001]|uniref:LysR substrate-binding domain-containing protein n=1 Tax=Fontimonas sp. SYSU GA230001 TaxID=3142450 RepID=UPI0032B5068E
MARPALPQLDLLIGFESAARHLSFTRAAAELHLTQSAISRQVQALEQQLGVPLFERRHRALLLTEAGQLLQRSTADALQAIEKTTQRIRGLKSPRTLTVTTVVSFASLWLVPRLPQFRAQYPLADVRIAADNRVVDLARERMDVAIRYCAPERAPPQARKLFGEEVMPMCSPRLLRDRARPLRRPEDLRHHTLLHDDMIDATPWLEWPTWLEAHGLRDLRPAGDLHFSLYDQMIQAALDGQGVALGRLPLLAQLIESRRLVAPFAIGKNASMPQSTRAFFAIPEPSAASRPEVQAFVDWVVAEAAKPPVQARRRGPAMMPRP